MSDHGGIRLGLALSGGTLKAAAHVGVLSALETLGVRPQYVAGTSAGSLVATLLAHGYTVREFTQLIRHFPGFSLLDYGFPIVSSVIQGLQRSLDADRTQRIRHVPAGFLRGGRLLDYIRKTIGDRQPQMTYYVIATDLLTGNPAVYSNDEAALSTHRADPFVDLARTVLGSCSLPGVLTPVRLGNRLLIDGAFRHYVPVHVLRQAGCNRLIAVNLYHLDPMWEPRSTLHVLTRAFEILLQESIDNDVEGDDLVVISPDIQQISWRYRRDMARCTVRGENAAHQQASRLQHLLTPMGQTVHRPGPRVLLSGRAETKQAPREGGLRGKHL